MLKFYIYSAKARRGSNDARRADFVALVTSVNEGWSRGWKCVFGPQGIFHPAVDAAQTPVPFNEVAAKLSADFFEGSSSASSPTLYFVPDTYYREVTLDELRALALREGGAALENPDTRRNVFIPMEDAVYDRVELDSKRAGYLSVGAYFLGKALGEPDWILLAREIVFKRIGILAPGTIFTVIELMTTPERKAISARQVGRAVAMIVENSDDPLVAQMVERKPLDARPGTYKRLASESIVEYADEIDPDSALQADMDACDEGLFTPQHYEVGGHAVPVIANEDPRDRRSRNKSMVAFWDNHRAETQGKK